jgi:glutathione S-transferase
MSELILHHYDGSPFSEKIRLIFGRKGLAWRSALQPNVMPKPELVPLTGGYRRIPVLQIGADVYCDSQRIARELERRANSPTLYPGGSEGVCFALNLWADRMLFQAVVPVVFGKIGDAVPKEFIEDRRKLMGGGDFAAFIRAAPFFAEQLRAQLQLLEAQLADGRAFLLGAEPSLADFAAYHPVWFLRAIPPAAAALAEFAAIRRWADRCAAHGHGRRSEIAPAEALALAKAAKPAPAAGVAPGEPNGLAAGDRVAVVPDDYGFDPVAGELVAADVHEVAVRRSSPETGEVVVHFPRAGFRVAKTPGDRDVEM